MNEKLNSLREIAESIFANSTQKKYWEHTKRVFAYAKTIGIAEKADLNILLPAVLLHDIGMTVDATYTGHVIKSQLLAKGILKSFDYNDIEIESINKVIAAHNVSPGVALNSLEEKILFDADSMEIIGVFGALRWIGSLPATLKELNSSINLFLSIVEKCNEARGSLFYTETGKKLGNSAVEFSILYYNRLKEHIMQFDDDNNNPCPLSL